MKKIIYFAVIISVFIFAVGCENKNRYEIIDCRQNNSKTHENQIFLYKKISTQDIGKIHNLALNKVRAKISPCNNNTYKRNLDNIYNLLHSTANAFIDTSYNDVMKFSLMDNSLKEFEKKSLLEKEDIMELYETSINYFLKENSLDSNFIKQFDVVFNEIINITEGNEETVKTNIRKFSNIETISNKEELFLQIFVNIYAYSYSYWTSNYKENDQKTLVDLLPGDSYLAAIGDAIGGAIGSAIGSFVGSNSFGKPGGIVGGIIGGITGTVGVSGLLWPEGEECCNPSCRCGCISSNMTDGINNGLPDYLLSEFHNNHKPMIIFESY